MFDPFLLTSPFVQLLYLVFDYPIFVECNFMGVSKPEPVKIIILHTAARPAVVGFLPVGAEFLVQ